MKLYLRFFNEETLVDTPQQAIDFLSSIPDVKLSEALCQDLIHYAEGKNPYPKRFKVSPRSYFIVIKTTAETMEEFKSYVPNRGAETAEGIAQAEEGGEGVAQQQEDGRKSRKRLLSNYSEPQPGWYRAAMTFKRVVMNNATGHFDYVDTDFEVRLKAQSVQDCYDRVLNHLRNRIDIDARSQFPSIRGRNFKAEFLGLDVA